MWPVGTSYHQLVLPRLYPILDTTSLRNRGLDPVLAAEAMLEGGARILQFRHKEHWGRAVFEQAGCVAVLCRRFGAHFVIDDRADIAVALDAGVHVGQDDLPAADARAIVGPGRMVGLSTHTAAQLAAALKEPVDYLAFGPVFATASKQNPDRVVGIEGLPAQTGGLPHVAIGGITLQNARAVLDAGADSVAVISGLLPEEHGSDTAPLRSRLSPASRAATVRERYTAIRQRMEEWQRLVKK